MKSLKQQKENKKNQATCLHVKIRLKSN